MQQHDERAVRGIETGFEDMYPEPVDIADEARANARRQHGGFKWVH